MKLALCFICFRVNSSHLAPVVIGLEIGAVFKMFRLARHFQRPALTEFHSEFGVIVTMIPNRRQFQGV